MMALMRREKEKIITRYPARRECAGSAPAWLDEKIARALGLSCCRRVRAAPAAGTMPAPRAMSLRFVVVRPADVFRRGNGEARRAAQFVLAWCRGSNAAKEQTQQLPGDLS